MISVKCFIVSFACPFQSVVMAKYLEQSYPAQLVGRTVLELGAGTGIVGIVASVLGKAKGCAELGA